MSATCNRGENTVSVKVYVGHRIAREMLPFLENRKEEIERQIGHQLLWYPYPERQNKSIVLEHTADLSDPQGVQEALSWLAEYSLKFREVFSKLIADFKESAV